MSRPVGSKNKKSEPIVTPPPVVEEKPKRFEAATTSQNWGAKPDMGGVKPPNAGMCKDCPHERHLHYGGSKNWCNNPGCQCQSFKQ